MSNRNIIIDGRDINKESDVHRTLAELMDFGPYYGRNWDTLWDRLSIDIERSINDDEFQLEHGNRPVKIISFTPKRIGVVNDDGDVKGMGGINPGSAAKAVNAAKEPVCFIEGVTVKDIKSGQKFTGTVDLKPTLGRIASGGTNPHKNDGSVFRNQPYRTTGISGLPTLPSGYYKEYSHPTPKISGPRPQRVIVGKNGEAYYTNDHYKMFIKIR